MTLLATCQSLNKPIKERSNMHICNQCGNPIFLHEQVVKTRGHVFCSSLCLSEHEHHSLAFFVPKDDNQMELALCTNATIANE